MFHQGDLQSGIALALQQAKSVVCFVRDDGDESAKWESEWLQDQNIPASLERNAVTIRMEAGSQEAGFLSAFYPVQQVPVVVVIWQGKVEEQLAAGITKNDFTLRLLRALNRDLPRDAPSSSAAASTPTAPPTAPASASTSQADRQARIQTLLTERKERLEAEKKARDEAERQSRKDKAKARDEASNPDGTKTAQRKHAEAEKKRIAEAAAEKERVRRLVEADKAARRERQEHARAQLESERRAEMQEQQKQADAHEEHIKANRKGVAIQVRLLNGEAIRGNFAPDDTPQTALRKWIDEQRTDGHTPYSFKIVQTPAPSRAITETEESQTLRELGLAPSASLVLIAARGAVATAYAGNSVFGRTLTIIALFLGLFGFIGNAIASLVGFGVRAAGDNVRRHEGPDAAPGADALAQARAGKKKEAPPPQGAGTRVRTLRDHDAAGRDDQQLYNGNQLNFQPRGDDDGDTEQTP